MGKTFDAKKSKQNRLEERNKTQRHTKTKNFKSKFKPKSNSKDDETKPKKVFDKKKWRLKKYDKQYQVEQWQDRKKKTVLREYYKTVKDDESNFDVQKIYKQAEEEEEREKQLEGNEEEIENENNLNRDISDEQAAGTSTSSPQKTGIISKGKKNAYKKAEQEFERLKIEKQRQKEEALRIKAEKIEAKKQYKTKKLEKYKLLNKKTKKGQPIMKYRMEMLLEQIQKSAQ